MSNTYVFAEITLEEGIPWQKLVLVAGVFWGCVAIIAIAVLALLKPRLPAFMTTGPFRKEGALGLVTAKDAEHGQIGTQNPVDLEGRDLDPTKVDVLG